MLAQRITDYYRAHGYPLSRATVPAQDLSDGVVQFKIIEARYDQVQVANHSRRPDEPSQRYAQPAAERPVGDAADTRSSAAVLNDLPGVQSHAALGPGARRVPATSVSTPKRCRR